MPRRFRFVLTGIGSALVALLAGAAVVQHRATASWAAMEHHAAAMRADFDRREHGREPLWGEGSDGDAFAEYARAAALAKPLAAADDKELKATLRRTDAQVAAETIELRARWQPVLEAMRAGAHHRDGKHPAVRRGDSQAGIANLLVSRWIANAAVFEARALRHAGQHQQAVAWTLDAMTFGADHVRGGLLINQMIGLALVGIASKEAWTDAALQQLDAQALDLLATGLDRLDAQLPPHLDLTPELLWLAGSLGELPMGGYGVGAFASWRFGFSGRWMMADAFARYATAVERLAASPPRAWSAHQAGMDAEMAVLAQSSNPMLGILAPNLTSAESSLRQTRTLLRLLRAAIGVLRGEDVSGLQDPLGDGMLSVTEDGEVTHIRSAGVPNGRTFERCVTRRPASPDSR